MNDPIDPRVHAATLLREFGHEFVTHELDETALTEIGDAIASLLVDVRRAPARARHGDLSSLDAFRAFVPEYGVGERRQLFADSVVSGSANPMGLGAYLWRDGDHAILEVTLGKAFEGAPERAHGGIVAALIDETIGLVLSIHGLLALTAQLDITYLAATPVNAPIRVRAWLESRDGRKLSMRAELTSNDVTVVEAKALFIAIDPERFRSIR